MNEGYILDVCIMYFMGEVVKAHGYY